MGDDAVHVREIEESREVIAVLAAHVEPSLLPVALDEFRRRQGMDQVIQAARGNLSHGVGPLSLMVEKAQSKSSTEGSASGRARRSQV